MVTRCPRGHGSRRGARVPSSHSSHVLQRGGDGTKAPSWNLLEQPNSATRAVLRIWGPARPRRARVLGPPAVVTVVASQPSFVPTTSVASEPPRPRFSAAGIQCKTPRRAKCIKTFHLPQILYPRSTVPVRDRQTSPLSPIFHSFHQQPFPLAALRKALNHRHHGPPIPPLLPRLVWQNPRQHDHRLLRFRLPAVWLRSRCHGRYHRSRQPVRAGLRPSVAISPGYYSRYL